IFLIKEIPVNAVISAYPDTTRHYYHDVENHTGAGYPFACQFFCIFNYRDLYRYPVMTPTY
ncbi:hypothetical protein VC924_28970, partial [Citrobacter freundii]|nr:hypothetical protein [Citrobacter freundii]